MQNAQTAPTLALPRPQIPMNQARVGTQESRLLQFSADVCITALA